MALSSCQPAGPVGEICLQSACNAFGLTARAEAVEPLADGHYGIVAATDDGTYTFECMLVAGACELVATGDQAPADETVAELAEVRLVTRSGQPAGTVAVGFEILLQHGDERDGVQVHTGPATYHLTVLRDSLTLLDVEGTADYTESMPTNCDVCGQQTLEFALAP
ncbi:MAG: hypothetical protein U0168_08365 [Nannocystaceae bacterium]